MSMKIGVAIDFLKMGYKLRRAAWPSDSFILLNQSHPVNALLEPGNPDQKFPTAPDGTTTAQKGNPGQMLDNILLKVPGNSKYWGSGYSDYTSWCPTQLDLLAEDWVVFDTGK